MRDLRVGDTVTFNDHAWTEFHGGGKSEFSERIGVLVSKRKSLVWLVHYADEGLAFGIHASWLLPIFVIEETP